MSDEERGQLLEVVRAAVGEVGVRLGGDAGWHRGQAHQLGVGRLFAGEDHHGARRRRAGVEAVLPGAAPAEQPDHDEVGAVEQRGQVVGEQAGRVGVAVGHRTLRGTGAHQVGVGRRQEQDHCWRYLFLGVLVPGR